MDPPDDMPPRGLDPVRIIQRDSFVVDERLELVQQLAGIAFHGGEFW